MIPLFDSDSLPRSHEQFEEGAVLLRGFATAEAHVLVEEVARIAQGAPFRHLLTPGGYTMSVAMTNCGRLGWVSDRTGYRTGSTKQIRRKGSRAFSLLPTWAFLIDEALLPPLRSSAWLHGLG